MAHASTDQDDHQERRRRQHPVGQQHDRAIAQCELLSLRVVANLFEVSLEQIQAWLKQQGIPIERYRDRPYVRRADLFTPEGQAYYVGPLVQVVHDQAAALAPDLNQFAEGEILETSIGTVLVEHHEVSAAWAS